MSITVPSAGATIRFESGGAMRSGSRKNATVKRNSRKKNHHNHAEKAAPATVSSAKNNKTHRASKSVWRRMERVYFGSLKQRGQDTKNQQMGAGSQTTISWALGHGDLQSLAEINLSKPRDYLLFSGRFWLWSFLWVGWPTFMAQVQEEIPVEKVSRSSTGIAATQKYDAAQIDKLEGLEEIGRA